MKENDKKKEMLMDEETLERVLQSLTSLVRMVIDIDPELEKHDVFLVINPKKYLDTTLSGDEWDKHVKDLFWGEYQLVEFERDVPLSPDESKKLRRKQN